MDRLGKILPRVLANQKGSALLEIRARLLFAEIVGPALAGQCEQLLLRGTVLTVVTQNPALAHQLRLDTGQVLERLNGAGLGRRIRELRVRLGRGPVS